MHAIAHYHTWAVVIILAAVPLTAGSKGNSTDACRYLPGDAGWPTDEDWSKLNSSIGGKLIVGTPLAEACYSPTIDPNRTSCAKVRDDWVLTET